MKKLSKKKRTSVHSIFTQLSIAFFAVALATGLLMIITYSPNVKSEVSELSRNYIHDLAIAYGETLDNEIKKADGDATLVLKGDNLYLKLDGVGIKGVESSYVYVVDAGGQMLHHPDDSKVGHAVENEVVKQYIADLEAGKETENKVVEYDFRGTAKYAGVYVSEYKEFILVVSADEDDILKPITNINMIGIAGMVVAMILCSIAGNMIAGKIVKPITQMTELTEILSDMDFTEQPEYAKVNLRKDEVGTMGRALSKLRTELSNMVAGIREESSMLLATSADLSVSAAETSTTMDQLESAVNEIAQGASAQAEDTQRATENVVVIGNMVEEANSQVSELIEHAGGMKKLSSDAALTLNDLEAVNRQAEEYINIIAQQTATTNESAQKINEAASMITDIAEETNLLSLNASIEAARAGEQGRGFAVVAAQIQKLAEQSNESAQQIGEIIRTLMEDSQKAVSIMGDVKEIMLKQSEHVDRTKEAFIQIQEGVDESIQGMDIISQKTHEMDTARAGVIDVVQNLSAIAQENAASAEETSASVAEVSAISTELSDEAVRLKSISNEMEDKMAVFRI